MLCSESSCEQSWKLGVTSSASLPPPIDLPPASGRIGWTTTHDLMLSWAIFSAFLLLTFLSLLAKLTYFYPLSKPSLVPMATYWGSSITMGTWLLGLNTPYHHSIKKYGERGRRVVKETEFRSSSWEIGWGKGSAVWSLEPIPHPILVLLG